MKTKRSIIVFWALFLMPTLIITGIAFKLLSHEQERINQSAINALSQRAEAISQTIHITIETIQDNLKQSLFDIDQNDLTATLLRWEGTNPLVRNVFIYKNQNLEYPVKGLESTLEERRFITRYDALFSGRVKFDFNIASEKVSAKELQKLKGLTGSYPDSVKYDAVEKKQTISSRQKLVALSKAIKKAPGLAQQDLAFKGQQT